jgi:hypothetical protein
VDPLTIVAGAGALVSVVTAALDLLRRKRDERDNTTVVIRLPDGDELVIEGASDKAEFRRRVEAALDKGAPAKPVRESGEGPPPPDKQ